MVRVRLVSAAVLVVGLVAWSGRTVVADLDPKAITIQLPNDIKWNKGNGSETATLIGDPSKPGLYSRAPEVAAP